MTEATWHDARKAPRSDDTDPHHVEAQKLRAQANEIMEQAKAQFAQ
jgi:hypothetical protein